MEPDPTQLEDTSFRQRRSAHIVTIPAGSMICININSLVDDCVGRLLVDSVRTAVDRWNSLDIKYRFEIFEEDVDTKCEPDGNDDVHIIDISVGDPEDEDLVDSDLGGGALPGSDGEPGASIVIAEKAKDLAGKRKTNLFMHEIGHTMGLEHTGSGDGTKIPDTPDTDPTSIMNSVNADRDQWSAGDIAAIRALYGGSTAEE